RSLTPIRRACMKKIDSMFLHEAPPCLFKLLPNLLSAHVPRKRNTLDVWIVRLATAVKIRLDHHECQALLTPMPYDEITDWELMKRRTCRRLRNSEPNLESVVL